MFINKLYKILLFLAIVATSFTICSITNASTILVLGDSLSAGYGIQLNKGWVALLSNELGQRHQVINLSVSGSTSKDALNRLPTALQRHRPTIVIVEVGANDALRGLPLSQLRENLRQIIILCQAVNAKVLLAGIDMPANFGNQYRQQFKQIFGALAQQYNTALLPLLIAGFETNINLFQADGIHPTEQAQAQILNNVLAKLRPLMK